VFAPGSDLASTSFAGDTATTNASGTSGSSPLVAAVAALYLQQNPGASAAAIHQAIVDGATTGRLSNIGAGSPNRLVHSRFGATPPTPTNLALGKPATGSASCASDEGPEKAVNGSVSGGNSDKWCALATGTKSLRVDLGAVMSIAKVVVRHAAAGGESESWNSRNFRIQTSTNGTTFSTVSTVTGNTDAVTTHTFAARDARFVRLQVTVPTQDGDPAARIYELEVYAN